MTHQEHTVEHRIEELYAVGMICTKQYNILMDAHWHQQNQDERNQAVTTVEYNSRPARDNSVDYEFVIRVKRKG